MKKYYILTLLFISIILHSEELNLALSKIYSPFRNVNIGLHNDIEEEFISIFADIATKNKYFVNIGYGNKKITKIIDSINKNLPTFSEEKQIIKNEMNNIDYCYFVDIVFLRENQQNNFYDPLIIEYSIELKIEVILLDVNKMKILDERIVDISTPYKRIEEEVIDIAKKRAYVDFKNILSESIQIQNKIRIVKMNNLFVWLNSGNNEQIKRGDIYISYDYSTYNNKELMAIKIISTEEKSSMGIILYKNEELTENSYFIRKNSSNLRFDLNGGFSLSELEYDLVSLYPFASIRALIPVGISFFNPVLQIELNFFFKENKLMLPFSFEGGVQGSFNFHRFEIFGGFLVGALFSPDLKMAYPLDSISVRVYLIFSAIINTYVSIYAEPGYRYYFDNILFLNWKISLRGPYFKFGLLITL